MEDTKGLPMNLIRCALAEAARLEHEQLAAKGEELMKKEVLSAPDYEAFKKKVKVRRRVSLKKKILYALIAALIAVSLAMSETAYPASAKQVITQTPLLEPYTEDR